MVIPRLEYDLRITKKDAAETRAVPALPKSAKRGKVVAPTFLGMPRFSFPFLMEKPREKYPSPEKNPAMTGPKIP